MDTEQQNARAIRVADSITDSVTRSDILTGQNARPDNERQLWHNVEGCPDPLPSQDALRMVFLHHPKLVDEYDSDTGV
jgi:hypothetical protein